MNGVGSIEIVIAAGCLGCYSFSLEALRLLLIAGFVSIFDYFLTFLSSSLFDIVLFCIGFCFIFSYSNFYLYFYFSFCFLSSSFTIKLFLIWDLGFTGFWDSANWVSANGFLYEPLNAELVVSERLLSLGSVSFVLWVLAESGLQLLCIRLLDIRSYNYCFEMIDSYYLILHNYLVNTIVYFT